MGPVLFTLPKHNPAPLQSAGSCRERCSCAGSREFLAATVLPGLGKVISLSALPTSLPAQQRYQGQCCPWAAPNRSLGLSKVTHQRNVPCITRPSLPDEVTCAYQQVRTLHG